jgi:CDP-glucose 4,6-dehydratase
MSLYKTYKNKKVLITGHTGFKGRWLSLFLFKLNANLLGVSSERNQLSKIIFNSIKQKMIEKIIDIRNYKNIKKIILTFRPDYIFHLAAQSIVKKSFKNAPLTWSTNLMGTLNLLESLKHLNKRCNVVIITSDKCYKNLEKKSGYKENDILGGSDPYSASKASVEVLVNSYFQSFFKHKKKIRIVTARAGNVVGGGDFSKNRIIPDCIKSWQSDNKLILRNPNSTRPWQHVLEPLFGYLLLGKKLNRNEKFSGEPFNFGPSVNKNYTVLNIVKKLKKYLPSIKWKIKINDNINETKNLILQSRKAFKHLQWKAILSIDEIILYTTEWYKRFYFSKKTIVNFSISQINNYLKKLPRS